MAKEMGAFGAIIFIIFITVVGIMILANNTAVGEAKNAVNYIGYSFLFGGAILILFLLFAFLLWLIKEFN